MTDTSWQVACADQVRRMDLDPVCLAVLRAFDRTALPGPPGDFGAVEAALTASTADLIPRLVAACAEEVDQEQSEMFGRRYDAVRKSLEALPVLEARILRVGLLQRMTEVVAGPGPRALRVRGVADFYASQAGVLAWRGRGGRLSDLLVRARWRNVAPGVQHTLVQGAAEQGPVHVNLLRVDPTQTRLEVVDCHGAGTVEDLGAGAVAAVSGGFFLYTEPDIELPSRRHDPVGLLLSGGQVLNPPTYNRGSLLLGPDGARLQRLGMDAVRIDGAPVTAWTRADGPIAPWLGHAVIGRTVLPGTTRTPPLNGVLLRDPVPDPVRWSLDGPWTEGIAGGPMLLLDGEIALDRAAEDFVGGAPPITFIDDETFDQNLLPRMGVGLRGDGTLVFAAVDGRNLKRALGLTLRGTGQLLRKLGCHTALNLDGGSSKRMVIDGRVVDLPSTEVVTGQGGPARVRPVHTAIRILAR
jgi:hypothetical protein